MNHSGSPAKIDIWKLVKLSGAPMIASNVRKSTKYSVVGVYRSLEALTAEGFMVRTTLHSAHGKGHKCYAYEAKGELADVLKKFGRPEGYGAAKAALEASRARPIKASKKRPDVSFFEGLTRVNSIFQLGAIYGGAEASQ